MSLPEWDICQPLLLRSYFRCYPLTTKALNYLMWPGWRQNELFAILFFYSNLIVWVAVCCLSTATRTFYNTLTFTLDRFSQETAFLLYIWDISRETFHKENLIIRKTMQIFFGRLKPKKWTFSIFFITKIILALAGVWINLFACFRRFKWLCVRILREMSHLSHWYMRYG